MRFIRRCLIAVSYVLVFLGSAQAQLVEGACGSSNGADLTSSPTANLCSSGTASTVSGSGPWSWSCFGNGRGTTATCSAKKAQPVNGACGSSNGGSLASAPTANLCSAGTASTIAGSGPWSWSCAGSNGGTTAACSAKKVASAQPVNGACGSSNGGSLTSAPTANLCTAGTASTVSGSGPWSWSCAGSSGGTTASCKASPKTASGSAPILIQHVASSANPVGLGISGNNYKIPLPNSVQAGDALVLAITYPHGSLITMSDTLRQTWPQASIVKDGGTGNYTTAIYVLCGSAGGSETVTVGLSSGEVLPFEYTVSEFNNLATSNCVDGSVGGANLSPNASGVINAGSFTPLNNNNSKGGHIIWSYTAISSQAGGNPTSWSPASGFKLLDGDIAWINDQGFRVAVVHSDAAGRGNSEHHVNGGHRRHIQLGVGLACGGQRGRRDAVGDPHQQDHP
jgi:hypothetical protein